jgi:hypothetical protein
MPSRLCTSLSVGSRGTCGLDAGAAGRRCRPPPGLRSGNRESAYVRMHDLVAVGFKILCRPSGIAPDCMDLSMRGGALNGNGHGHGDLQARLGISALFGRHPSDGTRSSACHPTCDGKPPRGPRTCCIPLGTSCRRSRRLALPCTHGQILPFDYRVGTFAQQRQRRRRP